MTVDATQSATSNHTDARIGIALDSGASLTSIPSIRVPCIGSWLELISDPCPPPQAVRKEITKTTRIPYNIFNSYLYRVL